MSAASSTVLYFLSIHLKKRLFCFYKQSSPGLDSSLIGLKDSREWHGQELFAKVSFLHRFLPLDSVRKGVSGVKIALNRPNMTIGYRGTPRKVSAILGGEKTSHI